MYFLLTRTRWFCISFYVSYLFALLCLLFPVCGLVTHRIALCSVSFFNIIPVFAFEALNECKPLWKWSNRAATSSWKTVSCFLPAFAVRAIAKSLCYGFFCMCAPMCACPRALTWVSAEARGQCWSLPQLLFVLICERRFLSLNLELTRSVDCSDSKLLGTFLSLLL